MILTFPFDLFQSIRLSWGAPFKEGRREFLYNTLLGTSIGVSTLGLRTALAGPIIYEVDVPINSLAHEFEGFTIAQISDLHVGSTIQRDYVERTVGLIEKIAPDLIVFTGDFADGYVGDLQHHTEPLGQLQAKAGKFYVTGNHEYYWNAQSWIEHASELGFLPLLNTSKIIPWKNSQFLITGTSDSASDNQDNSSGSIMEAAATKVSDKQIGFRLYLNHRPVNYNEAEQYGFHLQLSGHTHAGQFFPWRLLIPLAYRYYRGLYRHKGLWIYVSRGTGYWGPPHRFTIPAEVTLLRMRRSGV